MSKLRVNVPKKLNCKRSKGVKHSEGRKSFHHEIKGNLNVRFILRKNTNVRSLLPRRKNSLSPTTASASGGDVCVAETKTPPPNALGMIPKAIRQKSLHGQCRAPKGNTQHSFYPGVLISNKC